MSRIADFGCVVIDVPCQTRRMLVPGYALLYPEEKPAEDAVPKKK